jgi:hypothetical protein
MKAISDKLRSVVRDAIPQLKKLDEKTAAEKEKDDHWSKKEILGHLIDSASNNHQRIVRALYNAAGAFPVYDQNAWVRVQRYNVMPWDHLVELWSIYNTHLSLIIAIIPQGAGDTPCNIGKDEPVPLEFVVTDYLRHLQHHLAQLI